METEMEREKRWECEQRMNDAPLYNLTPTVATAGRVGGRRRRKPAAEDARAVNGEESVGCEKREGGSRERNAFLSPQATLLSLPHSHAPGRSLETARALSAGRVWSTRTCVSPRTGTETARPVRMALCPATAAAGPGRRRGSLHWSASPSWIARQRRKLIRDRQAERDARPRRH